MEMKKCAAIPLSIDASDLLKGVSSVANYFITAYEKSQ